MIGRDISVFIIHGTKGSKESHWFAWLDKQLTCKGFNVVREQYPTPEGQNLDNWLGVLERHKDKINQDTILVGHSIAAPFILNYLERADRQISAVYVAGGFLTLNTNEEYDKLNETFMKSDFDFDRIKQNCKNFFVFHSKDDPYVPIDKGRELAQKVSGQIIEYDDAGHFNNEAGYETFDDLYKLILKNVGIGGWSHTKQLVNAKYKKNIFFHERELWWIHNGVNIGYEQDGHGVKSLRPVLILKKINKHLFIGIPQTSQKKRDYDYYYKYMYGDKKFVLLLLQIRVFSVARLHEKLGMLNKEDFNKVKNKIKEWL